MSLPPRLPKRTLWLGHRGGLGTGGAFMKIVQTIIGAVLVVLGIVWILQGADILGGSFMSGQGQWLFIGVAAALAGSGLLYWAHGRRAG